MTLRGQPVTTIGSGSAQNLLFDISYERRRGRGSNLQLVVVRVPRDNSNLTMVSTPAEDSRNPVRAPELIVVFYCLIYLTGCQRLVRLSQNPLQFLESRGIGLYMSYMGE